MGKPKNCISVSEAQALHRNWVNTRANVIKSALGYEDVRDVVFSLEELQEYLDYVKQESSDQGITNPGIRIYFSARNEVTNDKATVFMAPTNGFGSGSANNYNIDPYNKGQNGWPPNTY